ncbi:MULTISPECIES: hypothetical protein [Acidithiobacillus]|uniref:Uncharacterized protein n=1 Tax=Acidithiobacillus thiooxidans TaxID=930 RepID=A0A1C2I7X4_ACITH|nr:MULTISPECIES: hypothetical protein [Acidithiobacillus]MBU2752810.1 hypothetical protein [Acidithiobacillus thiooxidans]MDD2750195.1 hypothetical protein [Acidithiobacillus sp.]MDD5280619.1 hypothetical protein [Acidithiobacillus sp.]MDX5935662.1 hypothetical protein [Acidithiobacillus thiooxidans]OCX72083.1 hypothetical protein A6M23_10530 [Acidithiobacillus thiooxidans]
MMPDVSAYSSPYAVRAYSQLNVLGKKLVFRLQSGGDNESTVQNNNKESDINLYSLVGIAEQNVFKPMSLRSKFQSI